MSSPSPTAFLVLLTGTAGAGVVGADFTIFMAVRTRPGYFLHVAVNPIPSIKAATTDVSTVLQMRFL